jgi:hypothetical protein
VVRLEVDAQWEGEIWELLWQVGTARRKKKKKKNRNGESALVYRFIHIIYIYVAFFSLDTDQCALRSLGGLPPSPLAFSGLNK